MLDPQRREFLFWGSAALIGSTAAQHAVAQQSDQSNAKVASLQDQLEKGLRARRKVEFEFIAAVVELVHEKRLTREVVISTFGFVVKKYHNRKYLVPIFEMALRKRVSDDHNDALDDVPSTLPPR